MLRRLRRRALRFTTGGRWTAQLHPSIRQNLRWFWFDGVFASSSDSIAVTYLSLFVLALGATRAQIGLMSALSSLSAALLLLPGATLVECWGHRKRIVVLSGGGVARIALLLLALVPLAFAGPTAVYTVIALAILRSAFGNLGVPAWVSLIADIVPLSWRGRYFSSRNMAMGVANMLTTFLAGQLITVPHSRHRAAVLARSLFFVPQYGHGRGQYADHLPRWATHHPRWRHQWIPTGDGPGLRRWDGVHLQFRSSQ